MRDTWYADNRDLVKWGVLAYLTQREDLSTIVQVPYLRFGPRPPLQIDNNGAVPISDAVWAFFRNIQAVKTIAKEIGCNVVVVPDEFDPADRSGYHKKVLQTLQTITERKVVLLDPDTGLAPNVPKGEHVSDTEIAAFWNSLNSGEWLVLYQHASRKRGWQEHARDRFSNACSGTQVTVLSSPKLAWDVCFLAARKH